LEYRSERYAAYWRRTRAAPMSPPRGSPEAASVTTAPPGETAKRRPLASRAATRSPPYRPNDPGATAMLPSMAGGVHGGRADLACAVDGQHRGRCPAVRRDQQAVLEMPNRPNARPRCNSLSGMTERREPRRSYEYAWVGTQLSHRSQPISAATCARSAISAGHGARPALGPSVVTGPPNGLSYEASSYSRSALPGDRQMVLLQG